MHGVWYNRLKLHIMVLDSISVTIFDVPWPKVRAASFIYRSA